MQKRRNGRLGKILRANHKNDNDTSQLKRPRRERQVADRDYEDRHLLNRFVDVSQIGAGTYGVVYKVFDKTIRQTVALKKMRNAEKSEGIPSTSIREIALLMQLDHPNIIKLREVISANNRIFLLLEFIDRDLQRLLKALKPNRLPISYTKSFLYQLLQGLAFCHTHRVIHRDLKPQNILVANTGIVKIADFGLARSFSMPSRCYTQEVVTLWYRAPELLLGAEYYCTSVDIWGLACILVELAMGEPLFAGETEIDQLFKIFKLLGTPTEQIWPGVTKLGDYTEMFPCWKPADLSERITGLDEDGIELISQMLELRPEVRITAKTSISHRFLRDVPLFLQPIDKLLQN